MIGACVNQNICGSFRSISKFYFVSIYPFCQRQSKCYWQRKLFWYPTHVRDCIIYTHCFSWYTRMDAHHFMAIHKCHNLNRNLPNHLDPFQNKISQAIKLRIKVLHFIILINCHINFKANVTRYFFEYKSLLLVSIYITMMHWFF